MKTKLTLFTAAALVLLSFGLSNTSRKETVKQKAAKVEAGKVAVTGYAVEDRNQWK